MSKANIAQHDSDLLRSRIKLAVSDGTKGYPDGAPYDVIHVGAAAERVPGPLLQQLKVGGMVLIPVGPINVGQNYLKVL
jgi:protein-L-isoaspartate(D-aspartate) O-methyltransferase